MKTILLLSFVAALSYAAVINIPIAKDVQISYANGASGEFSVHKTDSYETSCCSASNSYYIYAGFDISSLAGKAISFAEIQFAQFLAASPAQSYMGPQQPTIALNLYNTTFFRESPPYSDRNDPEIPVSDQTIGTLNVTVAERQQNGVIDVTNVIKEAIAAGKTGFYFSYGNSGGYSASITVAAREVNPNAIVIKVTYSDASSSAPSTVAPTTSAPSSTTSAPTTSAPTTSAPVSNSCSGSNVSGPNVASPARNLKTAQVCSGNGYCNGQSCKCLPGYEGTECEKQTQSKTCSANVSGPNVASPARFLRTAKPCNGNGECKDGKCACKVGFIGADCEVPVSETCSGANVSGANVASPARTNKVCNGNGYCMKQICVCNAGFSGNDCQNTSTTTAAPTTSTPSTQKPGENISGDNNARANNAEKIASIGGIVLAVAAVAAL